jgi:hypothetical protein
VNYPGSFSCECRYGYQRDEISGKCLDIDECLVHPGESLKILSLG